MRDLAAVAHDIADGTLSPVDLLEQTLQTVERLNPTLNAYITVLTTQARTAAREAEREIAAGHYRGPLHGVPISVKDLYWTRGIRTTAGARVLTDFVPADDAAVVERLHQAGAIVIAKANMLEFAYAAVHPDFGPTKNPWNLTRTTSGSSGGSAAAVASGMDFGSFGSDTGGSIRIPAAFCGVVGLKPSYGLVSRFGVVPLSWSLDHAGPFARTSRDLALLLQSVAGYDHRDRESAPRPAPDNLVPLDEALAGLRVALLRNFMDSTVNAEVRDAVRQAVSVLADAGASVTELQVPELESDAIQAVMDLLLPESSYSHRDWFPARSDAYSDTVRERLEAGRTVSAMSWFTARAAAGMGSRAGGRAPGRRRPVRFADDALRRSTAGRDYARSKGRPGRPERLDPYDGAVRPHRPAGVLGTLRLHRGRSADRSSARGSAVRGRARAPGGARLPVAHRLAPARADRCRLSQRRG